MKISVVIPCHNQAEYLRASVESALCQSYPENQSEVVIVDDASTDGSLDVARSIIAENPQEAIRLVVHDKQQGLSAARNTGIANATGEAIVPLDSDDKLHPHFLLITSRAMEESGADIIHTDRVETGAHWRILALGAVDIDLLPSANQLGYCSLFRKSCWEAVGGYRDNYPVMGYEDWEFWIDCAQKGFKFQHVPQPLWFYRQQPGGMAARCEAFHEYLMARIVTRRPELYAPEAQARAQQVVAKGVMPKGKRCVISMGVGKRYPLGIRRLRDALKIHAPDVDHFLWDEYPADCPVQADHLYGFKVWCFNHVRKLGYDTILWMDSACVPVRPLAPLFDLIEQQGHAFQEHWANNGHWTHDAACKATGITRSECLAMKPSVWATAYGIDLRHPRSQRFLERLGALLDSGAFAGPRINLNGCHSSDMRVRGHRGDQSLITILAYQLGMGLRPNLVAFDPGQRIPLVGYGERPGIADFPAYLAHSGSGQKEREGDAVKNWGEFHFWSIEAQWVPYWLRGHPKAWPDLPRPPQEEWETRYDATSNALMTYSKWYYERRYLEDCNVAHDAFAGKKVLDVGCGPFPCLLGFTDCERHGLDPLLDSYSSGQYPLHIWSTEYGYHYHEATAEDMPFEDASFDVVVCVNGLDHMRNLPQTAAEMRRVLRPGGQILLHVHYHAPTAIEPIVINDAVIVKYFGWVERLAREEKAVKDCGRSKPGPGEKFVVWRGYAPPAATVEEAQA